MSLIGLLTHTITTTRLKSGSGLKQTYETNLINQSCLIQPLSAEMTAKTGMVYGKSFNCFLPLGTDIVEGDRLTDQDGKQYSVTGLLNRNYGSNAHLTALLTMEESI